MSSPLPHLFFFLWQTHMRVEDTRMSWPGRGPCCWHILGRGRRMLALPQLTCSHHISFLWQEVQHWWPAPRTVSLGLGRGQTDMGRSLSSCFGSWWQFWLPDVPPWAAFSGNMPSTVSVAMCTCAVCYQHASQVCSKQYKTMCAGCPGVTLQGK